VTPERPPGPKARSPESPTVWNARSGKGKRRRGFTLIELAITLVIVGLLASLAVYTYTRLTNKARFTQAKTVLKHLQKTETVFFSENDRYTDNLSIVDFDPVKYPYYEISITLFDNATRFIGTATGVGPMKGDLWTITRDGEPEQDNTAKALF
jgi:prepilin-type N-terminal cleavage/methylation domain-containing protein